MLQHYVELLQSTDPAERKQAIKELARLKDPGALKPLAQIYRTDPDPEIRELAAKAGRFIKKSMVDEAVPYSSEPAKSNSYVNLSSRASSRPREEEKEKPAEPRQISQRDRDRAAKYVDDAIGFRTRGEDQRALELIVKALDTDPEQARQGMTINLAGALLNLPGVAAIDALLDPDARESYVPGARKSKRKEKNGSSEEGTWGQVWFELALYATVVIIGTVGAFYSFQQQIVRLANLDPTFFSQSTGDLDTIGLFAAIGIATMIIIAIINGIGAIVVMFIQNLLLHFAATTFLGGEGTYRGLFLKTLNFHSLLAIISAVFGIVYITTSFQAISTVLVNPATTQLPNLDSFGVIAMVAMVGGLVALFWFGKLLGDAYQFGMVKGCTTIFLAMICYFALSCVCSMILPSIISSLLLGSMGGSSSSF